MGNLSDYMNPPTDQDLYQILEKKLTAIQGMIVTNRFLFDNMQYLPDPSNAVELFKSTNDVLVDLENYLNTNPVLSTIT